MGILTMAAVMAKRMTTDVNYALSFSDNSTDRVITANNIPQQPLSINTRFKRNGNPAGTRFIHTADSGTEGQTMLQLMLNTNGTLTVRKISNNVGILTAITGTAVVTDNNWHTIKVYINGASYRLWVDDMDTPDASTDAGNTTDFTLLPFLIGCDRNSSAGYRLSCGGSIDEVKLWSGDEGTLAGHWEFDEGSGLSAADSSGNLNTGTITGATWQATV